MKTSLKSAEKRATNQIGPVSPTGPLPATRPQPPTTTEPPWVRYLLTAIALTFLGVFLLLPLAIVFIEANGWECLATPDELASITLDLAAGSLEIGALAIWLRQRSRALE